MHIKIMFISLILGFAYANSNNTEISSSYLKPQLTGIVLMGNTAFNRNSLESKILPNNVADYKAINQEGVDGVVINVTWSQLEPHEYIYDYSEIESALKYIRLHNQLYPNKVWHAKLRVWEGYHLPQWYASNPDNVYLVEKSVHGAQYYDVEMAKFWDKKYSDKITQLQHHLADRYDNEPLISEVSISSCSSLTDEPFVSSQDIFSIQSELQAGYTNVAYANCLLNAPEEYKYWKHTWLGYPINPFRVVNPSDESITYDVTTSYAVIDKFATIPNAHFDNHDLIGDMSTESEPILSIESQILKYYPQVHNQLQMYWMTTSVESAIPTALNLKANEVELWWDTINSYSLTQLQTWSEELKNNN